MKNYFEAKNDNQEKGNSGLKENDSSFVANDFFNQYAEAISDYAEDNGLDFKAGKGWSIEMKTGRATYDPNFFIEKGYSQAESMWAICHEIEHFRDWRKNPEAYANLFSKINSKKRLHVLYNCIDDIMVNRNVDNRFPAHKKTKEYLYQQKLFPGDDYTSSPKHLQFAYALLREKMLPSEILKIEDDVRLEVEKLKNIDGRGTDLLNLVSDFNANPADRFEIIRDYIEPIYEKFFQEDLEEKKNKEGDGGDGSDGKKKAEDYFSDEYNDFDSKSPEAISFTDIKDAIDKEIKRQKEEKQKSPEQIAKEQFEREHGVSVRAVENYRRNYDKIEKYISSLREVFERIISRRKEIRRRLKERTDQGVILDPSLISQAYIDAESGVLDSRTQLKVRKQEFDENKPNNFEFTLICDISGSMDENSRGGKSYEQKMSSILIMEALNEFEEKLKEARLDRSLDLHVFTEIRAFGGEDEELKPLSDNIDYQTRIKVASRLSNCDGGSTSDFKSLSAINSGMDDDVKNKISKNELKKVVLLITDGGSDNVSSARREKELLEKSGVIVKAIQIGKPGAGDVDKFRAVWQKGKKDGHPCKDVSQLVPTIEKLLEEFLNDL
jgi:hypothetical protein